MKILIFSLFIVFLPASMISQDVDFDTYLKDQEIINLREKNEIIVRGNKSELMMVFVNRDVTYKINKAEGAAEVSQLILPEPFDRTFILHCPDIRRNAWMLRGVRVESFTSSIERDDGITVDARPEIQLGSERLYTSSLGEADFYEYHFDDLEEGDLLHISYTYSFPFRDNWIKLFSSRIFFHSAHPKLVCDFTFSHPATLEVDTFLFRMDPPEFIQEGNDKIYSWHFEDLPGCLEEPGNRPYKELPHFTFSLKPYELIYEHWDSFRQEFVPLWLMLSSDREKDIRPVVMDAAIDAKDKDNLTYNKIADNIIRQAGNDSTGINRMQYFQKWMVEDVRYDDALSYYDNQENYMIARPSGDLMGGTIRDFAIEQANATMILKLGLNFFTAYPCDKRSGEMSDRYFAPMYNNDLMFTTILKNDVAAVLIPRSQYNQYYFEELPYYYEDIPVILIHTNDFGAYKVNISQSIRIMNTPSSRLSDNTRKMRSRVTFHPDLSTASFETSLSLSGQYSTLCRPVYFDRATDPTVNPDYFHKAWDIHGEVALKEVHQEMIDDYFPFRANVSAQYTSTGLVEKEGGIYTIDLGGCLYHIGYEGSGTDHRFTDFYPDFTGTDHIAYQLVFEQDVHLLNEIDNISLDNEYFTFSFSVAQPSPKELVIISYLAWKARVIPGEAFDNVRTLLEVIEKNKALSIQVEM
jgi:hypothetical protein